MRYRGLRIQLIQRYNLKRATALFFVSVFLFVAKRYRKGASGGKALMGFTASARLCGIWLRAGNPLSNYNHYRLLQPNKDLVPQQSPFTNCYSYTPAGARVKQQPRLLAKLCTFSKSVWL